MEFPRLEYWSGLPFPSPGDLPNPGIEPGSLYIFCMLGGFFFFLFFVFFFTTNATWEARNCSSRGDLNNFLKRI